MLTQKSVSQTIKNLEEKIKSFKTSKEFLNFVNAMSQFHKYSFHNQVLILSQKPDARSVAGFRTWKRFGRYVKRGEKGIAILVPIVRKEEDEEVVINFKTGYVFDISQTDGKPMPDISLSIDDTNDEFYSVCCDLARKLNVSVETSQKIKAFGVSRDGLVVER